MMQDSKYVLAGYIMKHEMRARASTSRSCTLAFCLSIEHNALHPQYESMPGLSRFPFATKIFKKERP